MTTTLYSYAERLAARRLPRSAALLLGLRWSFGLPSSSLEAIAEYSPPLNFIPLFTALAERGGLRIVQHEGDDEVALLGHLAAGEPAIVVVDVYHFPFRPAYGRVHSSRTVLVRRGDRDGDLWVEDLWAPPATGRVDPGALARARRSAVPLDLAREPLFAGNPVAGVWFEVRVDPPRVDDAAAWAGERLGWLADEMATPRADQRGEYGIGALARFRRELSDRLSASPTEEEDVALRRGASLLLRPELTSRLYLGAFLRNAAHLLGDAGLAAEVERYRLDLGHLQAANDVLTKTVRARRPEYDEFLRDQLARACAGEERLLAALARYGPHSP